MRNSIRDKQNRPIPSQARLSLKISHTSKKKPQKTEGRMSMLPLKRQRLSVAPQNQTIQVNQYTALKNNTNLLNSSISQSNRSSFYTTSCQKSIRKQTIINNLVNKLDQQQQIRSIIETKLRSNNLLLLKGNSYGPNKQFMYTSEFQPYTTNSSSFQSTNKNVKQILNGMQTVRDQQQKQTQNDENTNKVLVQKLKRCQQELDYFKQVIADMSKKMKKMEQKQFSKDKTNSNNKRNIREDQQSQCQRKSIKNTCCNCNKNNKKYNHQSNSRCQSVSRKSNAQISIQTSPSILKDNTITVQESQNYEFDFFDNLDRTLKILSNSKQL